jgi:hypothetical protein
MELRVEKARPEKFPCELLLLFSFENAQEEGTFSKVDLAWKGFLSSLVKQGDFKARLFQCRLVHTQGKLPAKRVLL